MFKFKKINKINLARLNQQAGNLFRETFETKAAERKRKILTTVKYLVLLIIIIIICSLFILALNFFALKQVYSQALLGKDNLEQAVGLVREQQFSQAKILAENSRNNFIAAINQSEEIKSTKLVKYTPFFKSQINNIEYLLSSAEFLSQAVSQSASFGQDLSSLLVGNKKLNFQQFSKQEKQNLLAELYQSTPELNGLAANISLSLLNLEQVNLNGLLFPLKGKVSELEQELRLAKALLAKAIPLTEILPALAGYPEKAEYLVILENNDELRPTGGFIGTYGILNIDSGDITDFATHDIYHLDMPVKDKLKITPPEPLKKYLGVDYWYLRDANWSPDWPTAAKKIIWFYQTEARLAGQPANDKFTGVIALTPQFIIDLLNLVGPITVDGTEYNSQNFQDLLQYKVERDYMRLGVSSWQRKEVIGIIARELKTRLFNLPSSRWPEALNVVDKNLLSKNILLYLSDPVQENIILQKGWAGEIKDVAGDYLMVVDANMAALKTDAVMNRSLEYRLEQGSGELFAKLRINYSHQGNFDWKTTRYRTYTRIYVPLGSQLISARGFTDSDVETTDEYGKTSFAGFFSVEPGKIGSLYLEYKLPDKLSQQINSQGYSLYVQKQPGNQINQFTVDLNFINQIKSYSPASLSTQRINNNINWQGDLNMDRSFQINFK